MSISKVFKPTVDLPSPRDIIPKSDIEYDSVKGTITIRNILPVVWLTGVQDTNSMDPTVDAGHTCLLTKAFKHEDLAVGDIVVAPIDGTSIIHRIHKISVDSQGRKYTLKGDNNYRKDPYEFRDEHIQWLLLAIIY